MLALKYNGMLLKVVKNNILKNSICNMHFQKNKVIVALNNLKNLNINSSFGTVSSQEVPAVTC